MSLESTAGSQVVPNPEVTAEALAGTDPAGAAPPEASQAPPTPTPEATPAAPTTVVPARTSRTVALVLGRRLLRFTFAIALVGLGVAIGWQAYLGARPVSVVVGDPAVAGVGTPAIVAELANAIAADDADAIRAALDPTIFSSYTADLQNFGIVRVESVDTLGTYEEGPRTATELVLHGRDAQRAPFAINLVVLTQDGLIVRLR